MVSFFSIFMVTYSSILVLKMVGRKEYYTLSSTNMTAFCSVLAMMFPGRENILSPAHAVWRESYTYDKNGNRLSKTTTWGKIEYAYDAENRLVSKGRITYHYAFLSSWTIFWSYFFGVKHIWIYRI